MKKFSEFIKESAITIPRNTLDPNVFMFEDGHPPILNQAIKAQIINDVHNIERLLPVKDYYIVGSILTRMYSANSDIDVTMEVYKEDVDDVVQVKILSIIKDMNGKLATGTQHPINYYVTMDEYDENNFDGVYDLVNERWRKEPKFFEINLQNYVSNFQNAISNIDLTTAQLRRDVIDFEEFSKLPEGDVHNLKQILQSKLYEINRGIENLVGAKKLISHSRKDAFARALTPEEILKYKSKNALPENVIYKLLQKYYYFDFISRLEKLLGKDKTISQDEVKAVKAAEDKFYGESFKQYTDRLLLEKIRDMKLKPIKWGNDKKLRGSHLYKTRGMDRKILRQVPQNQRPTLQSFGALMSAKSTIDTAKAATSGIWKITTTQAAWLAKKYHHIQPDAHDNIKHLGNTGIMVWLKGPKNFYLVKPHQRFLHPKHHKHSKQKI